MPLSRIRPADGVSKPAIQRSTVVLPQPLGPEQAADRAARERERDAAHGFVALVGELQVFHLEQGIHAAYSNKNYSC